MSVLEIVVLLRTWLKVFKVSASSPLNSAAFYIKKVGSPADITVRVVTDNSGVPSATTLLSGTLSASKITTSFAWATSTFQTTPILDPNQTYWLVLDAGQSTTNYYTVGTNSSYGAGQAEIGQYGSTWTATTPSGLDFYFQTYLGGGNSTIGGGTYVGAINVGTGSVGDAWAHIVSGAQVAGNLYCQIGTYNSTTCNTSKGDPTSVGYPLSDANVTTWKNDVTSALTTSFTGGWTSSSDISINYQGTSSTLSKITGNLTVGCNSGSPATFGNLYVTGNVTVSSGCQMNATTMRVGGALSVGNTGLTVGALEVDGNATVSSGGVLTAGPMEVGGNLDVQSTLDMLGTVWTVGTLSADSGSTVKLDPTYGAASGVLVSDGVVSVSGGSTFSGSGQSTSFPLIVTTSDCPVSNSCGGANAITINGGAGAVVLDAQHGTISMSGGTAAEALTANQISVTSGATVTYNTGLANLSFSTGPSGGYNISSWKEVQ